jgi:hypothetical protein
LGLVVDFHRFLLATSWTDIEEDPDSFDLRAVSPRGRRAYFEMKTIGGSETTRARAAHAQLLEYRFFSGTTTDALAVVADRALTDRRVDYFTAHEVAVFERQRDGTFRAANRLATRLTS